MPICTVERNRTGSRESASAARAPARPLLAACCSRARREASIAASAMAKIPLSRISSSTKAIWSDSMAIPSQAGIVNPRS